MMSLMCTIIISNCQNRNDYSSVDHTDSSPRDGSRNRAIKIRIANISGFALDNFMNFCMVVRVY